MLDERESFLCAIYDHPDDPTPKLVYADWLEEHGEVLAGQYLRLHTQIRIAETEEEKIPLREAFAQLRRTAPIDAFSSAVLPKPVAQPVVVRVDQLENLDSFRQIALNHPQWFAATRVRILGDRIPDVTAIRNLFEAKMSRHVTQLDLSGRRHYSENSPAYTVTTDESGAVLQVQDENDPWSEALRIVPFFTLRAFEAFVLMRATNRLSVLDLRDNNLDNDSLRALVRSPHFAGLKRLYLSEGNTFRGRVWQQVVERFGSDVVE